MPRSLGRSILKALFSLALVVGLVMVPLWTFLSHEPRVRIPGDHPMGWLSPDGSKVVTQGSTWLWDAHTGEPVASIPEDWQSTFWWPVFSPDRKLVAWDGGERIVIGNLQTGDAWVTPLPATGQQIQKMSFSGDSRVLSVLSGEILLLETADGRVANRLKIPDAVNPSFSLTTDANVLAGTGIDSTTTRVNIWDGRTRRSFFLPKSAIELVGIAPDGKTLLTIQKPKDQEISELALWDVDPAAKSPRACFQTKLDPGTTAGAFSPDSTKVALWNPGNLGSGPASVVEFWSVQRGERIAATDEFEDIEGVVWSPDSSRVAVSSVFCTRAVVGKRKKVTGEYVKLSLHNATTGRADWEKDWYRDSYSAYPTFGPSGKTLAAYVPNCIRFLDLATGATRSIPVPREAGFDPAINFDFTPDNRRLLYRERAEKKLKVNVLDKLLAWANIRGLPEEQPWDLVSVLDLETERELVRLEGAKHLEGCLSADGRTLATMHEDHIAIWDVPGWPPLRWALGLPLVLWGAICLFLERGRFRSVAKVGADAPR